MIISPLDNDNVLAPLAHQVAHVVVVAADVLHVNLLAGSLGSVNSNEDYVVTCQNKVLDLYEPPQNTDGCIHIYF